MKTETSRDERVTKTQTSRLTDRQIDRETGRQIDGQTDRQSDRRIEQSPRCTKSKRELPVQKQSRTRHRLRHVQNKSNNKKKKL